MGSANFETNGTRGMLFYFFLFSSLDMFLFCFISHQIPDTWRVCRWTRPYCLKQSEQDGQQSSLTSITIFMKKIDHVYTFIGICIDYMRAAFFIQHQISPSEKASYLTLHMVLKSSYWNIIAFSIIILKSSTFDTITSQILYQALKLMERINYEQSEIIVFSECVSWVCQ